MYRPTKNLSQIQDDYIEREVFETAATHEAQARFKAGLKKGGYNSVEAMMDALRGEAETDLESQSADMELEAEELRFQATNPTISPEDSFEFLVQSMVIEERMRVYDEVIDEFRADDLESTDKN